MRAQPLDVQEYETESGERPFSAWLNSLRDRVAQAQIETRIARLRLGLLGKWKPIQGSKRIKELIVDFGPGYRVYIGEDGPTVVVLLIGGSKAEQRADINRAKKYWDDYNS